MAELSPYARVSVQTGPGNEYDYSTNDYYIVVCNTCGIRTKRLGDCASQYNGYDGNPGHDKAKAWANAHNKEHHPALTEIPIARATAEIALCCGHTYADNGVEGAKTGVCNASLRVHEDKDMQFTKPMYVCAHGHYNQVPLKMPVRALQNAVEAKNAHFKEVHKKHRIAHKIAALQKQK